MADELKNMLKKVLGSKGEKKFFFAYAMGNRKDGKGEGELAVAGKKPKKADLEKELQESKDFYEGFCWVGKGPENEKTVYFQGKGKKLSSAVVTKMTKSAKISAGQSYDFQMPSPEEEARAEKLGEGEGEGEGDAPAPSPPPPPPAAVSTADPRHALLVKRLNALSGGIKAAMAGPNKARVQTLFVSADGAIKKNDFDAAAKLLDELEKLVGGTPPPPPAPPQHDGAELTRRLNSLTGAIKTALGGPEAGRVQSLFGAIGGLIKSQDFTAANGKLTELEKLLGATPSDSSSGGISLVKLGQARVEWDNVRNGAIHELTHLQGFLREEYRGDPEEQATLTKAIQRLDSTIAAMNENLGNQLDLVLNADATQRPKLAVAAKAALQEFVKFIDTDEIMSLIDANEYVPEMEVAEPLRAHLQAIAAALG